MKYVWRNNYRPRITTKNGPANLRSFEAIGEFIKRNGPQTKEALEAYARRFQWHHQYGVNVPGGVEFVRWHISHGNLVAKRT